jgi:magnesium chelatase subunit I
VANYETLVAASLRRALRAKEQVAVPRVSDLDMLASSTQGKVEIEALDEREGNVIDRLMKAAVLTVFKEHLRMEKLKDVIAAFDTGLIVHTGDDVPAATVISSLESPEAEPLRDVVRDLVPGKALAPYRASALEFLLEGLHLSKRLNKDASGAAATYRAR